MSTFKHRQPIISWSSVVLLSTLLLSPMTAASVLHVLAQAFPHAFSAASEDSDVPTARATNDKTAAAPAGESLATPRRANDEQEALRHAVAKAGRLRAVRLETDPAALLCDSGAGAAIAVRVPSISTECIADSGTDATLPSWPAVYNGRFGSRIVGPTSPRAPPFS